MFQPFRVPWKVNSKFLADVLHDVGEHVDMDDLEALTLAQRKERYREAWRRKDAHLKRSDSGRGVGATAVRREKRSAGQRSRSPGRSTK